MLFDIWQSFKEPATPHSHHYTYLIIFDLLAVFSWPKCYPSTFLGQKKEKGKKKEKKKKREKKKKNTPYQDLKLLWIFTVLCSKLDP